MTNVRALALAAALVAVGPLAAHAEFRHFDMTVEEVTLQVAPGFKTKVWAYNGQVPGPLIHVKEGDEVEV